MRSPPRVTASAQEVAATVHDPGPRGGDRAGGPFAGLSTSKKTFLSSRIRCTTMPCAVRHHICHRLGANPRAPGPAPCRRERRAAPAAATPSSSTGTAGGPAAPSSSRARAPGRATTRPRAQSAWPPPCGDGAPAPRPPTPATSSRSPCRDAAGAALPREGSRRSVSTSRSVSQITTTGTCCPISATDPISRRRCSPSWIRRSRCRSSSWCRSTSMAVTLPARRRYLPSSCAAPRTPPDLPGGSGTLPPYLVLHPLREDSGDSPQGSPQLRASSRLARRPMALPPAAAADPAALASIRPSLHPPPPANAGPVVVALSGMPRAIRRPVPGPLILRGSTRSLPSAHPRVRQNDRRQIQHGRFLRTAPTSVADRRALAADHRGRLPACSSRPAQWVIPNEQARVISGERRSSL